MTKTFSVPLVLGFVVLAAACHSSGSEPPTPAPKPVASAPAVAAPQQPSVVPVAVAPVTAATPAPAPKSVSKKTEGLTVKRFVVASGVERREPIAVESVELGAGPVFAFAELQNGGEAQDVVITFEREGGSQTVGHVELAVPAETKRWRTWGKTNLIDKPGRWSAVLRDRDGKELARESFEVGKLTTADAGRMPPG